MPARLFRIYLINETSLTFRKIEEKLNGGEYTPGPTPSSWRPPDTIPPTQGEVILGWQSESDGFMTGTEGHVVYEIDAQNRIFVYWTNPFYGPTFSFAKFQVLSNAGTNNNGTSTFENFVDGESESFQLLQDPRRTFGESTGPISTEGWIEIVPGLIPLPLPNLGAISHAWAQFAVRRIPTPRAGSRPQTDAPKNITEDKKHSGSFIQGTIGTKGNFELVIPQGNRLVHYSRNNDLLGNPWVQTSEVYNSTPISSGTHMTTLPIATGVGLIQSNFKGDNEHGNLEAIVRMEPMLPSEEGAHLSFFYFDSALKQWKGPFPILADGKPITGVTGNPALIQSTFGTQGNFELVVPQGSRLVHYSRNNDLPGTPWMQTSEVYNSTPISSGNQMTTLPIATGVGLIQSNFKGDNEHGNLEAIVRLEPMLPSEEGAHLSFFYFESALKQWKGPFPILADGKPITGVTGNPVLIQSTFGTQGNFELVVPQGSRLVHYSRNNDLPGFPWVQTSVVYNSTPISSGTQMTSLPQATGVGLTQSNFKGDNEHGNLELIVRMTPIMEGEDYLVSYLFNSGQLKWHGPFTPLVNEQIIGGVTGL